MQRCPHCRTEVIVRELPHQGFFKSYRVCDKCGGSFTADADTKYRQALFIVIALISLAFTLFLYYEDTGWLVPALTSYVALGLLTYWGNKKMFFVPYNKDQKRTHDT
jgi:uncharacterized protein (DUF983 family)